MSIRQLPQGRPNGGAIHDVKAPEQNAYTPWALNTTAKMKLLEAC